MGFAGTGVVRVIPVVHSPKPADGARLSGYARQAAGRAQRAVVGARG